jgi:hypothetical protein
MGEKVKLWWGIALLALIVLPTGCGQDSSAGAQEETAAAKEQKWEPRVSGPSRGFLIRGGDNAIEFFGHEATPAERERASRVIHAWMRARVAKDWARDCKYLSRIYSRRLANDARGVTHGKATTCTQALRFFGDEASGTSGNTLTGPIDSLRVRGVRAFAQWHGPHRIDWILPLRNENGSWKVEAASPIERTA